MEQLYQYICHSFRSLVRLHDYHHSGLRIDGQGRTERVTERVRCLRTILTQIVCSCGGGGICRGPRTTTSFGPQRELPLPRLVIHRQTSARAQREETLRVQPRSGMLAFFFTHQH